MSEFQPKSPNGSLSGAVISDVETPEVVLPLVGDTMKIAVQPWGGFQVVDEFFNPTKGCRVIEVEVKGFKEVKVIYE